MANSFGLLLLAVVIIFVASRLLKDAKAFSKYMAILGISLLVGAGVKELTKVISNTTTPEKTVMIEKVPCSTCTVTPFVLENNLASLECMSKDIKRSDNFLIYTEGLPAASSLTGRIDDS